MTTRARQPQVKAVAGAFTVTAGAGSYALTGTDAGTLHGWLVTAATGSYALTGTDATLTKTTAGVFTIAADPGSYLLTGTAATLTYQPITPVGVLETRGEWPEKRRRSRSSERIHAARQARDALRQAIDRLYDGGEYDAPLDVLEDVQAEAVATVNALNLLPEIPLQQLQIAEELIRRIQELTRMQLMDKARAEAATILAQEHLRETINIAAQVYRKTRFDYLARYALLTVE